MAVYFSILLVVVTLVSGVIWLADKFYFAPLRRASLEQAQAQCETELSEEVVEKILTPAWFIDTPVQIFPVIAFVLVLRSFIYEPFQIPSGSMMPTLLDGDFILVNKYDYGLRDPVARNKFLEIGAPERGDIVVFKFPLEPQVDYIKRVIGLPGDKIIYKDKVLYIKPKCTEADVKCPEFKQVDIEFVNNDEYLEGHQAMTRYTSLMPNQIHDILVNNLEKSKAANYYKGKGSERNPFVVPEGQYFVLGDNRDNSLDSRFWGFVPEENLVGRAVAIWMSFDFERTQEDFLPTWIPTGVRFERIGGIE